MNSEQNGQQIVQQGLGAIASQVQQQEQRRKQAVEFTKNYGKQQAIGKATSKIKEKFNLQKLVLNKTPKGVLKQLSKFNEARAKGLSKLSNSFLFKNNFIGKFFKGQAEKSMAVAEKINAHLGGSALKKGTAEVVKQGATKVATKAATQAASVALAAPTAGLSVAVEKTATIAKAAVDVGKKGLEAKGAVDVAKDVATGKNNQLQNKANNLMNEKTNEMIAKVTPGAKQMQGILNKTNQKEDKNKDTSMAIFSGTKDLATKVAGKSHGLDILK
jgi:hypothetical protein